MKRKKQNKRYLLGILVTLGLMGLFIAAIALTTTTVANRTASTMVLNEIEPDSQTAFVHRRRVAVFFTSIGAAPNPTAYDTSSSLYWQANRGNYCVVSAPNGTYTYYGTGGSHNTGNLQQTTTYYIKCYDSGGANSGETPWTAVTVSVNAPPACTSAPNGCGMTNSGNVIGGVCNASTPPDSDCPACTSAPNGCGMTNSGNVIGGVCNASTPSNSLCPACTSAPNGCGMTNSGNVIGGVCNASTPSNSLCPACTSAPNACGQRNTGNILGGVCSATTPSNASCPPPTMGGGSFTVQPNTIGVGTTATLRWNVTNATVCHITSTTGFSSLNQTISGSISTGPILAATTYTLTCQNGAGGPQNSKSIKVIIDPHFKEV